MAIAYDTATQGGTTTGTSLTFSHTCTGANRILFVGVFGGDALDVLTGITYGGVSMSFVAKVKSPNVNHYSYLYVLTNPASGANNVVVSWSGTHFFGASAISYTGAKQSGQPDASNTATSAGTNGDVSVTTVADNCWVMMISAANTGSTPTAGTGTTRRTNNQVSYDLFDSNGAVTPAGTKTLYSTWAVNGTESAGASFAPAITGPTTVKTWNDLAIANVKTINNLATGSVKSINGLT